MWCDTPEHVGHAARPHLPFGRYGHPVSTLGDPDAGQSSPRRELVVSAIHAQAARLFAERGFAGTSLGDIAKAAGFSRQGLYHYVKSKDELFENLVTDITRSPISKLRAINSRIDLDAKEKLRAIAKAIATNRAENPHSFLLAVRSEANLPNGLSDEHREGKKTVLDEIVLAVDAGQSSGQFRQVDPRVASLSILGMLNWVAWWFNPDGRESAEVIGEQVADLAVSVVAQPPNNRVASTDPEQAFAVLRDNLDALEQAVKVASGRQPRSGPT